MDFKTVYGRLKNMFPGIDYRLLKAVAVENSGDVDAAVEVVFSQILPLFGSMTTFLSDGDALLEVGSSSEVMSIAGEESNVDDLTVSVDAGVTFPGKIVDGPVILSADACVPLQWPRSNEKQGLILCETPQREAVGLLPNSITGYMLMNSMDELDETLSQERANTESEYPTLVKCQDLNLKVRRSKRLLLPELTK